MRMRWVLVAAVLAGCSSSSGGSSGSTGGPIVGNCSEGCSWCGQTCVCGAHVCPTSSGSSGSSTSGGTTSTSGTGTTTSGGSSSSSTSSSSGSGSTSGSSSGSSGSSGSSSSGSGSSSGSSGSSGSTGAADAGVYSYTLTNNTYYCTVYQGGQLITLTQNDAGCVTQMPSCIGDPLPLEPEIHVPEPMRVAYLQEPPADGPHWACWAPWDQTHAFDALPAERFIHNSEHSGVVLLYNCDPDAGLPDGGSCAILADPLIAYATDGGPTVPGMGDMRYLVTARPGMPTTYTAIAWGWRIEFDDFDAGLLDCFASAHLGAGPENTNLNPSDAGCPQSYAP